MAQGIVAVENGKVCCSKCGKTLAATNFYTYKDGSKCELCKSCLTMHINNWEPDTYLWLLEKFDVPYIPREWNNILNKAYEKDPNKITPMSVFGKYLSKMKLKQWGTHNTWADTAYWEEKAKLDKEKYGTPEEQAAQKREEMRIAFENGEITEAQYQTYAETQVPEPTYDPDRLPPDPNKASAYPANSDFEEVELVDVGAELTQEDKVYLAMKWGRLYHADEWVALEKLYNEFMQTFDIQGAARLDTLKMICKTSLKMNQAIDCGDVDTYQKLSRVYDSMMKSAKFTQAQNDSDGAENFDSVGAIVAFCEAEGGFIPQYEIKTDKDVIDTIIRDNREYLNTLIHNDTNLSQQIEQFLKKKEIMMQQKVEKEKLKAEGCEAEVSDQDFADFYDFIQKDKDADLEAEEVGEDE